MSEVLLGHFIADPLTIHNLALGKCEVHRAWNPVILVEFFDDRIVLHKTLQTLSGYL